MRWIRVVLLTTTICGTPGLAQADPVSLVALAATAAGAGVTAATTTALGATLAGILGAVVTAGLGFLGQQLFGPSETARGQNDSRTRQWDTHAPFDFAFGEAPNEGVVSFHKVIGDKYYLVIRLCSVPIDSVTRVVIQEHTDLHIEDLGDSLYDMQATGNNPQASGTWDDGDFRIWVGRGDQTQPPQRWIDEGALTATDNWAGQAVAFIRLEDGDPEGQADRFAYGKPPPLRFYGKWAKLYDPRKDPSSGVSQLDQIVISMALTTPPGSPADGDAYVPAATATGAWVGHEDDIAVWDATGGLWQFTAPTDGAHIWNLADGFGYSWDAELATPAWVQGAAAHDFDDPTTWEPSANGSLCALMLATHRFALGFDTEIIPIQQVADAADDVDAEFLQDGSAFAGAEKLRLLMEGANLSTTLIAEQPAGLQFTVAGNTWISTDQVAEGSSSLWLDFPGFFEGASSGDNALISSLMPGDNEFSFRVRVRVFPVTPTQPIMTVFAQADSSTVRTFRLRVLADGRLEFVGYGQEGNVGSTTTADQVISLVSSTALGMPLVTPGEWHEARVERLGDDWKLYIDGIEVASDLGHAATLNTGSGDLKTFVLGRWENNRDGYKGYIDALRMWVSNVPLEDVWGCNGIVRVKSRELNLLDPVLNTFAGQLDTTGGLLGWRAGVWKAPTDTLVQPQSGSLTVKGARDAGFDAVRASYISSLNNWEETDGPGYALRAGSRVHPLELPLVAATEQAAKLEKRFALRAEPLHTIEGVWDATEADRRVGERVNFSLFGLDRTSSTYAITSTQPVVEAQEDQSVRMGVRLTLEEDLAANYGWQPGDFDRPEIIPETSQPVSDFGPPTTVTAAQENYASGDGSTVAARLAVTVTLTTAVAAAAGGIEIEVLDGGSWVRIADISITDETQTSYVARLDPVLVGVVYKARARTVRLGEGGLSASAWVESGSVTIVEPVRAYTGAYTGAYV